MSTNLQLNIPNDEILPHHRIAKNEAICELRKTPTVLYGLFTEVVRQFYLNGSGYLLGTPPVKWDINPDKTSIWIDSELNWNDEHPEFRPAIYVSLGQIQFSSPLNQNSPVNMNVKDAIYYYARQGIGSVSFVHLAQRSGEALALCDNTAAYLSHFASQIRDDFCFTSFVETAKTPLTKAQHESSERYASVTTFSYGFGETWSSKLESPILKEVGLKHVFDGQTLRESVSINTDSKSYKL